MRFIKKGIGRLTDGTRGAKRWDRKFRKNDGTDREHAQLLRAGAFSFI
jgi:hypothetical protein